MKKKVIELIRVSTEGQAAEDRAGIPAQRAANRRTCQVYGLEIVRSIEMSDVSGASVLLAPEIQDLIKSIQSPEIHGVVAREFSRLMRPENFSDYALLQAFAESRTVLYLPDGPLDLTNKTGRLMGTIRAAIAGLERSEILERIWTAKEEQRRSGKCPQSPIAIPFGVTYDRKSNQWDYLPSAERVREAFLAFLSGDTNYARLSKMVGVSPRGMHLILRNPIYSGWRVYDKRRDLSAAGKYEHKNGRQVERRKIARAPEEVIRVKVIAKPLITEQQFAKVQAIMDQKERLHWRADDDYQHRFTYNGFLYCSACGQIIHTAFQRDDYYVCKGRKQRKCDAKYMRRDKLEDMLDELFASRLSKREFLNDLYQQWQERTASSDHGNSIERLQSDVKDLTARRGRVIDNYVDGLFDKAERDKRLKDIDSQLKTAQAALNRAAPVTTVRPQELAKLLRVFIGWRRLDRNHKRTILATVLPEIHVTDYVVSGFSIFGVQFGSDVSIQSQLDSHVTESQKPLYIPMTYKEEPAYAQYVWQGQSLPKDGNICAISAASGCASVGQHSLMESAAVSAGPPNTLNSTTLIHRKRSITRSGHGRKSAARPR